MSTQQYKVMARLDNPLVERSGVNLLLKSALIPSSTSGTPVNAVAAVGTVTASGAPTAAQTLTIGSEVYTMAASRTDAFTVAVGTTHDTFLANLKTAIDADSELVTAGTVDTVGHTLALTYNTKGVIGNSVVFTETCTNVALNGSGVLGATTAGVNGTVAVKNTIKIDGSYLWFCTADNTIADANWKKLAWA